MAPYDVSQFPPEVQKQIMAKLAGEKSKKPHEQKQPKESKYHNEKASRGKLTFDSKKEARRFDELVLRQQAGEIRNLKLQSEHTLMESFMTLEGTRIQAIRYRDDFSYEEPITDATGTHWVLRVEDAKGVKTDIYKMKRKLFREKYGFDITDV